MKCPICSTRRATSTHHIKPRDDGGSDNHKNTIMLCKPCHDIVEEVYSNTGAELSPQVIELIKLEYGFPTGNIDRDINRSVLATSLYRLRMKRKYKFAKEKSIKAMVPDGTSIRCSYCGGWHLPEKNGLVICPKLKAMTAQTIEAEASYRMLMEKIEKVRQSIE